MGAHLFLLLQLAHRTVTKQHGLSKANDTHRQRKQGGETGAHLLLLLQLAHESAANGTRTNNAHC